MHTPAGIRQAKSEVNLPALRAHRLARLRGELARLGYGSCVLVDPVNLRYATGSRNMQVFMLRNPARYAFVPVEGPVVLFDFDNCEHLSEGLETIDDVRPAVTLSYVAAGTRLGDEARRWADEIADLVRSHGGGNRRVAIDRPHPAAVAALAGQGIEVGDGQEPVEVARSIKSDDELDAIRLSIASTEIAMGRMREALRPGLTENELWSILHQTNIELDGEYVETRLLTSGHRTNPWFQECSAKTIAEGELLAFDTDVNAAFGYYADISRTWLVGDVAPTDEQRRLYAHAHAEIEHNLALMEPGMAFREYAERAWRIPDEFYANRYFVVAHGVGLSGEYPYIAHARDFDEKGYDGTIEPGMTFCIESYIGAKGGDEGVKLEEQVLVTEQGVERLSSYPFESALLA